MAATLTQERFAGPEWIVERKLDGIRLLAASGRSRSASPRCRSAAATGEPCPADAPGPRRLGGLTASAGMRNEAATPRPE
jgi:hypothetical protein